MTESIDEKPNADDLPEASDRTEEIRSQGAADFMGPGFLREIRQLHSKRRAYEFWYHPYTELAIFALIILSVVLLVIEVAAPTGEAVGWMGGLAAGVTTGWFFWADAVITFLFFIEYTSKLWIAPKGRKWFFVRNSWLELLALLPVLRVFRLFRIFRAVRIFRVIRVLRSVRLARTGTMITRVFHGFGSDIERNRAANMVIIAYFFSAMLFGTIGVLIFEKGAGSGFETIGDGLWWCIVTLSTVGYGDIVPETGGGRIVASIVVMLGLGFWSLVTGVFASTLVQRARRKETIGLDILGIHNHILICGWNSSGSRLVHDFKHRHPARHIVIVTETENLGIALDARLHHLQYDPTTSEALEIAHIERGSTVVLLAEEPVDSNYDNVDIDARTLMICLAARQQNPDIRIVVELMDEDNYSHARSASADDIVITHNYAGALISQSVQSPGLHQAYSDLFDVGRGSRFDEISFPEACIGEPFSRAAACLYKTQRSALIGFRRDRKLHIAPNDEPIIADDDRAIVIASIADPED